MSLPVTTPLMQAPAKAIHVREHAGATLESNEAYGLYLLFDAACHPDGLKAAQDYVARTGSAIHNLLDGLPEGDESEVGCYLMAIQPDHAEDVFAYWADPDRQPAAVWLWSIDSASGLAAHLRRFVLVKHRPNESGLLRFADPHVWRALTVELEESVGQMLSAPFGAWWIADLDGGWQTTRPLRRSMVIPASPIVLTEQRVAKLEDAMWPVQIYFALYPEPDGQPVTGSRMARLETIREEYARAKEWGGRDAQDYVMFSGLADEFGTEFDASPVIRAPLQAGKEQRQKLANTLRSIAPSAWEKV